MGDDEGGGVNGVSMMVGDSGTAPPPRSRRTSIRRANGKSMKLSESTSPSAPHWLGDSEIATPCTPRSRRTPIRRANGKSMKLSESTSPSATHWLGDSEIATPCPPRSRRTPIRRANGKSMRPSEALLHRPRIGLAIRRSPLLAPQGVGGLRSAAPMGSR